MLRLTALALAAALSPLLAAQGPLTTTVIGDSTGFASIVETDMLNYGSAYWIEPRTASFARIEAVEGGRRIVHDGVPGPAFPAIAGVTFSPFASICSSDHFHAWYSSRQRGR